MLTAKKFAARAGITYPTVIAWLKKGLIPNAKFIEDSPLGSYWEIPAASLAKVQKQKTGPKPKGSPDDNGAAEADQVIAGEGEGQTTSANADDRVEAAADVADESTSAKPKRRASKRSPAKKASKTSTAKKAMKKATKKGAAR